MSIQVWHNFGGTFNIQIRITPADGQVYTDIIGSHLATDRCPALINLSLIIAINYPTDVVTGPLKQSLLIWEPPLHAANTKRSTGVVSMLVQRRQR